MATHEFDLAAADALAGAEEVHRDYIMSVNECMEALLNSAPSIWKDHEAAVLVLENAYFTAGAQLVLQHVAEAPERFGELVTETSLFFFRSTDAARTTALLPYELMCQKSLEHMQRLGDALARKHTYDDMGTGAFMPTDTPPRFDLRCDIAGANLFSFKSNKTVADWE